MHKTVSLFVLGFLVCLESGVAGDRSMKVGEPLTFKPVKNAVEGYLTNSNLGISPYDRHQSILKNIEDDFSLAVSEVFVEFVQSAGELKARIVGLEVEALGFAVLEDQIEGFRKPYNVQCLVTLKPVGAHWVVTDYGCDAQLGD